jgi:hypothetical protein
MLKITFYTAADKSAATIIYKHPPSKTYHTEGV